MAPKNRVIIDTDPGRSLLPCCALPALPIFRHFLCAFAGADLSAGVDDVLAMLLALSASPEELEVAMISVTYGNVPQQKYVALPPKHSE